MTIHFVGWLYPNTLLMTTDGKRANKYASEIQARHGQNFHASCPEDLFLDWMCSFNVNKETIYEL